MMFRVLLLAALVLLPLEADASPRRHHIAGQVIDRNGEPVERAIVSLDPGNVQIVTDSEGRFLIDYLRNEDGRRVRLDRRTQYVVEIFKPGYHITEQAFEYRRGSLELEPLTMVEETIDIERHEENLDPGIFGAPPQSSGATYEGQ